MYRTALAQALPMEPTDDGVALHCVAYGALSGDDGFNFEHSRALVVPK